MKVHTVREAVAVVFWEHALSCSPRSHDSQLYDYDLGECVPNTRGASTYMRENTWARLRDSRPGMRAIHAT